MTLRWASVEKPEVKEWKWRKEVGRLLDDRPTGSDMCGVKITSGTRLQ